MGNTKLTFEELTTVLPKIEAGLNSRLLVPITHPIEELTPGHFLIGRPLCALPQVTCTSKPISLVRQWTSCQNIVNHFWKRRSTEYIIASISRSTEYIASISRFNKWHYPSRNLQIRDIAVLKEDGMLPIKWAVGRVYLFIPVKITS